MKQLQQRLLTTHAILHEAREALLKETTLQYGEDISFTALDEVVIGIKAAMDVLEEIYEREIPYEAD